MGRNSFQTFATGSLQTSADGTLIEGEFSAHPGFRLGRRAWGCMMIFIGFPTLLGLLSMINSGELDWKNLSARSVLDKLIILAALVAPTFLYALGRLGASEEAERLRQFLLKTLEARDA